MHRTFFIAATVILALITSGTLVAQTLLLPGIANDISAAYPELRHFRTPFLTGAILLVCCAQVALFGFWKLLSGSRHTDSPARNPSRWIGLNEGAGWAACVLLVLGFGVRVALIEGGPDYYLFLAGLILASGFALFMRLGRNLLSDAKRSVNSSSAN